MNVATHSLSSKQMCDEAAEQNADLGAQPAQQLKDSRDVVRRAEDSCSQQGGTRTEHCGRSCGDATTGACDSEGTEDSGRPTGPVH